MARENVSDEVDPVFISGVVIETGDISFTLKFKAGLNLTAEEVSRITGDSRFDDEIRRVAQEQRNTTRVLNESVDLFTEIAGRQDD